MSGDEMFILLIASGISVFSLIGHLFSSRSRIYLRDQRAEGLVRFALLAALGWIIYVLYHYADESVVGIYRLFYVVLGFAVIRIFGFGGARITGMRRNVDVIERNNLAAGLTVAAFVLATGMIFGGSLWGEADPDGDGEGGWWIPMGFFLAGWFCLLIATWLYRRRETGGIIRRIRQIRTPRETLAFALYILSSGWVLAESVAGDFHGWRDGLITTGALGGMLIVHEVAGLVFNRKGAAKPQAMTGIEVLAYLATAAAFTLINRHLMPWLGLAS